jgi:hypothetical protein
MAAETVAVVPTSCRISGIRGMNISWQAEKYLMETLIMGSYN